MFPGLKIKGKLCKRWSLWYLRHPRCTAESTDLDWFLKKDCSHQNKKMFGYSDKEVKSFKSSPKCTDCSFIVTESNLFIPSIAAWAIVFKWGRIISNVVFSNNLKCCSCFSPYTSSYYSIKFWGFWGEQHRKITCSIYKVDQRSLDTVKKIWPTLP